MIPSREDCLTPLHGLQQCVQGRSSLVQLCFSTNRGDKLGLHTSQGVKGLVCYREPSPFLINMRNGSNYLQFTQLLWET